MNEKSVPSDAEWYFQQSEKSREYLERLAENTA